MAIFRSKAASSSLHDQDDQVANATQRRIALKQLYIEGCGAGRRVKSHRLRLTGRPRLNRSVPRKPTHQRQTGWQTRPTPVAGSCRKDSARYIIHIYECSTVSISRGSGEGLAYSDLKEAALSRSVDLSLGVECGWGNSDELLRSEAFLMSD